MISQRMLGMHVLYAAALASADAVRLAVMSFGGQYPYSPSKGCLI